ncbi:hypothetical protein ACHAWU_009001 [Discostella pseudostelligera]|uniref:CBS domain-containing protein n=1 Tax=Discostella pseudostelligera TaxID=259834 RepID=A0ABD3MKC1_9STRA
MSGSSSSNKNSATTLLNIVKSYRASDVLEFTAKRKVADDSREGILHNLNASSGSSQSRPEAEGEDDDKNGHRGGEGRPSSVIVVDSTMTPLEAATLLWENNIMGAPVYDATTKTFVGMFDVRDILSCVTAAHREYLELGGPNAIVAVGKHHTSGEDIHQANDATYLETHRKIQGELLAKAIQRLKISTKPSTPGAVTVSYLAARNPVDQTYSKDTLLLDICKGLTSRHMHRVPITDSSSGTPVCIGIISQSGLVAFLASKCPHGSLDETMIDAGLSFRKDVVQVAESETAFTTFELLDSKRLSGIAVVDEDGKLIGNTSAVDIKNAVMDAGRTVMDMDILSYLACVRQSQVMKNCKVPNCHVREDATVGNVVNLLAKTGFHRVFVVDDGMKPVGVISFTDIIQFFVKSEMDENDVEGNAGDPNS